MVGHLDKLGCGLPPGGWSLALQPCAAAARGTAAALARAVLISTSLRGPVIDSAARPRRIRCTGWTILYRSIGVPLSNSADIFSRKRAKSTGLLSYSSQPTARHFRLSSANA